MNHEANLCFKIGSQKVFSTPEVFKKKIPLIFRKTNSSQIPIIELLNFLKMLPYSFTADQICSNKANKTGKFGIHCQKCNGLMIFQTNFSSDQLTAEIRFVSICVHIQIQVLNKVGQNCWYTFIFKSDVFTLFTDGKMPFKHPFRLIGKKIYKNTNSSEIVKEYLEKRIIANR